MPWYLYFALKQLFPTGKRVSFFAVVSVLGVMLGVMVLLIVQSVMNGLGLSIRQKLIAINGDIQMRSEKNIGNVEKTLTKIRSLPDVSLATPLVQGLMFLQYADQPFFPVVLGIDAKTFPLERLVKKNTLERLNPSLAHFDDSSLLMSRSLARALGCKLGEKVTVYSPLLLQKFSQDEVILPRELTVTGIFETPWADVDANAVICSLPLFQELYDMGNAIHAIRIQVKPSANIEAVAAQLNKILPQPEHAYTWLELNKDLLFILRLEKSTLFLIIIFIVLVASFSISASLLLSVIRRTREIGLLRAMGAKTREIAVSFCFQGAFIGILGTTLGIVFGMTALTFRDQLVSLFAKLTHSTDAFETYYRLSKIPAHYSAIDFILIIALTLLITTLAGVIPAWRAAQLQPSEALRNE